MRKLSLFLLLLALPLVAACDSADPAPPPPPPPPSLGGSWAGSTTIQGLVFSLSAQLVENNGVVNGNGTLTYQNPLAVTITGTYNFPSVSMTIRASGFEDLNYSATLGADGRTLSGTMSGSGFDNFGLTLTRQ